jgi:hypothetical protein
MRKKWGFYLILLGAILILLPSQLAFAQATNVQTNTASDNTNVNQFVLPGGTGYGGTTNNTTDPAATQGTNPAKYPRTWFNPMILPGVSGPIYYGGPVRFGKELLDVGILIRFKPTWDSGFARQFAHNRPGKVKVSESVPTPRNGMSAGAVTMTMRQPSNEKKVRDFNRSYQFIDCYSVDGTDGADSAKLLGMAAEKANIIGADLGIIVNQGANFELYGKDSQQVVGFSPSLMGGGAGSVAGGALGFALGWAQHRAKYLTQPFLVVLLFKGTGVPYNWDGGEPPPEKKPRAAVPQNGGNHEAGEYEEGVEYEKPKNGRAKGAKGETDIAPARGPKLPYHRPPPSVLIEEQPKKYNQ